MLPSLEPLLFAIVLEILLLVRITCGVLSVVQEVEHCFVFYFFIWVLVTQECLPCENSSSCMLVVCALLCTVNLLCPL